MKWTLNGLTFIKQFALQNKTGQRNMRPALCLTEMKATTVFSFFLSLFLCTFYFLEWMSVEITFRWSFRHKTSTLDYFWHSGVALFCLLIFLSTALWEKGVIKQKNFNQLFEQSFSICSPVGFLGLRALSVALDSTQTCCEHRSMMVWTSERD